MFRFRRAFATLERHVLLPPEQLRLKFKNANQIDHEHKVTLYWNFLCQKIEEKRSGYFIVKHPTHDIKEDIIKMLKEADSYRHVDYVMLNDGEI